MNYPSLPTTPLNVTFTPGRTPRGEDVYNFWQTVLPTELNRLERLLANTNQVVNAGSYQVYGNSTITAASTVANTTTETSFGSSYTIPANTLIAGQSIRMKLYGVFSLIAATGTIRVRVYLGGQAVLDTGAITMAGSLTNQGWTLDGDLFVTTAGGAGQIEAQGTAQFGGGHVLNLANTAAYTVNTAVFQAITFSFQFGTAASGNSATLRAARVEIL